MFVLGPWLALDPGMAQDSRSIFSVLDIESRVLATDQQWKASLSSRDLLSPNGRPIQIWALDAPQVSAVEVELRSDDFDALLYIVGPGLDEGLMDDDGGEGTNARICFVPHQLGDYRVVVSSFDRQIGNFTLSAASFPENCPHTVERTIFEGDLSSLPTEGRSIAVGDEFLGQLTDSDPLLNGLFPVQAWRIDGVSGESVSVDLISDTFDPMLTLLGPSLNGDYTNDDGAGNCDARITVTFPQSGEYRLIVSTTDGIGLFRIVASERPTPPNPQPCLPPGHAMNEVDNLESIPLTGVLRLDQPEFGTIRGDEHQFHGHPLQAWTLNTPAAAQVAITLTSEDFDTYLFFEGPGFYEPLADDDSAGEHNSRICVELPAAGTYFIFAGAYDSDKLTTQHTYKLSATATDSLSLCDTFHQSLTAVTKGAPIIGANEERHGLLTGNLVHPESGRPIDPWHLRATPGTVLHVDVLTDDFDAYLYVLSTEDRIFTADDLGDNTNARIEFTIPPTGESFLLVSSYYPESRGRYALRTYIDRRPLDPSQWRGVLSHLSLANGDLLQGLGEPDVELPLGTEISGVLDQTDDVILRGFAEAFTYHGSAGELLAVELISDDFDTFLYITGPGIGDIAYNDDGISLTTHSRIEITLPETGTYTVVVSTWGEGSTGTFKLRAFRVLQ